MRRDGSAPERAEAPGGRPRRRHRTDWMALLSGLLFIALGLAFVSGDFADPLMAVPLLLAGLGVAGFVAVIVRVVRKH